MDWWRHPRAMGPVTRLSVAPPILGVAGHRLEPGTPWFSVAYSVFVGVSTCFKIGSINPYSALALLAVVRHCFWRVGILIGVLCLPKGALRCQCRALASVGLRRRSTLILACLRSLIRVPQNPLPTLSLTPGAWPLRNLIGEYRAGSTFRLIVWGIESLTVVSTAAF